MRNQSLLSGFIRIHILHHAAESEIYGQWIIEELARHGYTLSAGTLYPMLHALERQGYLRSRERRTGSTLRRLYRATAQGRAALNEAKDKLRDLVGEVASTKRGADAPHPKARGGSEDHQADRQGSRVPARVET